MRLETLRGEYCPATCDRDETAKQRQVAVRGKQHREAPEQPAARCEHQQPQPAPPDRKAEQRRNEHREVKQQAWQIACAHASDPRRDKAADQPHQRRWRTVAQREREGDDRRQDNGEERGANAHQTVNLRRHV